MALYISLSVYTIHTGLKLVPTFHTPSSYYSSPTPNYYMRMRKHPEYCITTNTYIEQEKVLEFGITYTGKMIKHNTNCLISMFFRTQEGIIAARVTTPKTAMAAMAISTRIAATPHTLQKQAHLAYFRARS